MQIEAVFRAARSFDAALDLLAENVVTLGFDAVDYAFMPRARGRDGAWNAPEIVARNFPPHWTRGWSRYASEDPYLCTCYQRNLPLDWNEVKGAAWLSNTQRQAITFIDDLGFLDGITVPIHLPGGSFAFVSALSRPRQGAWRAQQEAMKEKLFILAHAFHAGVDRQARIASQERSVTISPRELDVLRHAASGLNAPATARIIHRSVETIRRQRKSAMSKLGSHTIAQAIALAISMDLLDEPVR
ncbi:MAG: LuxR family transcriptional regulator [Gammaproteobacteria bacterium]|nr:LuxR family transcriptional regulator [Gammaproteobacteria bacterium]